MGIARAVAEYYITASAVGALAGLGVALMAKTSLVIEDKPVTPLVKAVAMTCLGAGVAPWIIPFIAIRPVATYKLLRHGTPLYVVGVKLLLEPVFDGSGKCVGRELVVQRK